MNKRIYRIGHLFTRKCRLLRAFNRKLIYPKIERIQINKEKKQARIKNKEYDMEHNGFIYPFESRNGVKMYMPHFVDDLIQRKMFLEGDFFNAKTNDYLFFKWNHGKIINDIKGKNIIDIGANIGDDSVYFGKEICTRFGSGCVYAFEPVPETYSILDNNIRINELKETVKAFKVGVGDKKSRAQIRSFDADNSGGTSIEYLDCGNIEIITLDEMKIPNVGYIKIDTEGFEAGVIKGAVKTIEEHHPYLYIEILDSGSFREIASILKPMGYSYYRNPDRCVFDYLWYIKK